MKRTSKKFTSIVASALVMGVLFGQQPQVQASTIGPVQKYNGVNAAKYAKKYANNPNKAYHEFSSDCTNFVSQCVFNGGRISSCDPSNTKPKSGGKIVEASKYWYYIGDAKKYVCSTPWVRCANSNAFYHFFRKNVKGTFTSLANVRKNARVGDVIQVCDSKGKIHHSIICVEKTKSEIYCASHTSNYAHDSLAAISARSIKKYGKGVMFCVYNISN